MPRIIASVRHSDASDVNAQTSTCLDAGCESVVLSQPFYRRDWQRLRTDLPAGVLFGCELFTPLPRGLHPGMPCPLRLGTLHREDKRDAENIGAESIRFASAFTLGYVFLPSVRIDAWVNSPGSPRAVANRRRHELAERHFDSFLSSVDRLLSAAERASVQLLVTPVAELGMLPNSAETTRLLHEFRGAPIGVWPDTLADARESAAAEEESKVGEEVDTAAWRQFGEAVVGATLRDTPGDAPGAGEDAPSCLPGHGQLDWRERIPALNELPFWLLPTRTVTEQKSLAACIAWLEQVSAPPPRDELFG